MTINDIRRRVREARKAARENDFEAVSSIERQLLTDVLQSIADRVSPPDAHEYAVEALRVTRIKGPRW